MVGKNLWSLDIPFLLKYDVSNRLEHLINHRVYDVGQGAIGDCYARRGIPGTDQMNETYFRPQSPDVWGPPHRAIPDCLRTHFVYRIQTEMSLPSAALAVPCDLSKYL